MPTGSRDRLADRPVQPERAAAILFQIRWKHRRRRLCSWIAGTSPAMTAERVAREHHPLPRHPGIRLSDYPGSGSWHDERPCHGPSPRPFGPTLSREGERVRVHLRCGAVVATASRQKTPIPRMKSVPTCPIRPARSYPLPLGGRGSARRAGVREPRPGKELCAQMFPASGN